MTYRVVPYLAKFHLRRMGELLDITCMCLQMGYVTVEILDDKCNELSRLVEIFYSCDHTHLLR